MGLIDVTESLVCRLRVRDNDKEEKKAETVREHERGLEKRDTDRPLNHLEN